MEMAALIIGPRSWVLAFLLFAAAIVTGPAPSRAQQFPSANSSQFRSAVSLYQAGKFAQARKALEPMLVAAPNDYRAHELMALIASAQHRTSEAEHEFKKAAELAPDSYEMNHNLGEFYIRERKLADAIPYLQKAQNLRASYDNGYDLALAEIDTGRYAAARRGIQELVRAHDTAELHELLAGADEKSGQYVEAAKEYERAARMDPSEENIFAWGSELLQHHTVAPAIEVFSRGVHILPHSARLRIGLGIALFSGRRYGGAFQAMCQAIDISPSEARPYLILGQMYDIAPAASSCVEARFARFARLEPDNPKGLYYYALSLWETSRARSMPEIDRLLEKAIKVEPGFGEAHLQLGIVDAANGNDAKAMGEYQAAVRLDPGRADAHYRLAQALLHAGRHAAAQSELATFNRLRQQQAAEWERRRRSIVAFAYQTLTPPSAPR